MSKNTIDRYNRGSNQSGLRAHNERQVLSLLRRHGAHAKAKIAQMTGLSAQTVSVIMRQLESDGLLVRGAPQRVRGKVGQPSVPMSLAADGAYFFGLKLGRRSSDLVLIDFLGNIVDSIHDTYKYPAAENILAFTESGVARITSKLSDEQKSRVGGLGIGMPFQIWNWVDSTGAPREIMNTWRSHDLRAELAELFDFPVYLQNDATAACGAELVFGQYDRPRDFAYFYLGYFIGGGLVLGGNLHPGPSGNAGAFGSMQIVDSDGNSRQLIDVASLAVLERYLVEAGADSKKLWQTPDAWDIDRKVLDQWINDAAEGISQAIVTAESVFDFEAIIIDGWMPREVRDDLVAAIELHVRTRDFTGLRIPEILPGRVGPNARALGAASLPLSQRFMADQCTFLKG